MTKVMDKTEYMLFKTLTRVRQLGIDIAEQVFDRQLETWWNETVARLSEEQRMELSTSDWATKIFEGVHSVSSVPSSVDSAI